MKPSDVLYMSVAFRYRNASTGRDVARAVNSADFKSCLVSGEEQQWQYLARQNWRVDVTAGPSRERLTSEAANWETAAALTPPGQATGTSTTRFDAVASGSVVALIRSLKPEIPALQRLARLLQQRAAKAD